MNFFKIIALVLLIVFVGIQFFPTKHNLSKNVPNTDFIIINNIPNNIKASIQTSCYDCHSNNTSYPWYSRIQPVAMFLENHIEEAKEVLNFSEWDNYSERRKKSKLQSIISQIEDNEMPLKSYKLMHKKTSLSNIKKKEIIEWLKLK